MKVSYEIIDKLHKLNRVEWDLFLYIVKAEDQATGKVEGVFYLDVMRHQYYEEKKSLMEKVKSCIQQSISGIKYSERTLENKFVHKLLKKALGVPESM